MNVVPVTLQPVATTNIMFHIFLLYFLFAFCRLHFAATVDPMHFALAQAFMLRSPDTKITFFVHCRLTSFDVPPNFQLCVWFINSRWHPLATMVTLALHLRAVGPRLLLLEGQIVRSTLANSFCHRAQCCFHRAADHLETICLHCRARGRIRHVL